MQLAFDIAYTDPVTGMEVPWAKPSPGLLRDIAKAPWKIVDVETTELNLASVPINFSGKDLRRGVDPTPRLRVTSILVPLGNSREPEVMSFDYDQLTRNQRLEVSDAVLTQAFIAHNAGYDLGWLRYLSKQTPSLVLDSMLIARALFPQQLLELAKIVNDEEADFQLQAEAKQVFEQDRSGWSLADLAVTGLGKILPKDLQGPRNWCVPFLTQAHYTYATDDVRSVYDLLLKYFGLERGEDLLEGYKRLAVPGSTLKLFEPQVLDVARMREHGMPWSVEQANKYADLKRHEVVEYTEKLLELEPVLLAPHAATLRNFSAGVSNDLRNALGECFRRKGLVLQTTEKENLPMVGEKDLRKARAALEPESKPLFDAWTHLCRAKKAGQMALDFSAYALRSPDKRIHSNISHGPATGRLSSGVPNVQQAPADQAFRDAVRAALGFKILACDYSALDVRVAAALAIRAQRQIFEVYLGVRKAPQDVVRAITCAYERKLTLEQAMAIEAQVLQEFKAWKEEREEHQVDPNDRRRYWEKWRELQRKELLSRFQRCLIYVRNRADQAGTAEWGSLRDAFSIPGMDIHTWTALSMQGEDPVKTFADVPAVKIKEVLKEHKKRLGDSRKTSGKIPNLALQYRMQSHGLQEYAAKGFNVHWTLAEADEKRVKWLATYVEVDLWHCWTELNSVAQIYVPDSDHGGQMRRQLVFASYTLAERLIYAIGVSSALAYEDQSTGADILADDKAVFRGDYPEVFDCLVNEVHDELVFEIPDEKVEEYIEIVSKVMVACAERYLAPYGVRAECSPTVADVWVKD